MSHPIHLLSIQINTQPVICIGFTTSNCFFASDMKLSLCTVIRYFRYQ